MDFEDRNCLLVYVKRILDEWVVIKSEIDDMYCVMTNHYYLLLEISERINVNMPYMTTKDAKDISGRNQLGERP